MKTTISLLMAASAIFLAQAARAADLVYGVEIAPGGKHYAVLRDVGDQKAFAIYDADNASAKPAAIGIGKNEVEEFEWGGDDHILLRISGDVGGVDTVSGVKTLNYSRWLSISRQTGEFRTIFGNEQGNDYFYLITSAGALVATLPKEGDRALFARSYAAIKPTGPSRLKDGDDELLYSLLEANLKTGDTKRKSDGASNTVDWIVTADGIPVARVDQNEKSKGVEVLAAAENGRGFKKVAVFDGETVEAEQIRFLGVGASPRSIQILRTVGGERRLFDFDIDAAAYGSAIATPGPISDIFYDPREARARYVTLSAGSGQRTFHLDADDQKTQASLEKALAGAAVTLVSKSADGARLIARADYADRGSEYYFFDKPGKRLELVAAND